jgi:hypothetical protein
MNSIMGGVDAFLIDCGTTKEEEKQHRNI